LQSAQYKHVQSVLQQGSLYTVTLYTKALGLTIMQTPSEQQTGKSDGSFYRIQREVCNK